MMLDVDFTNFLKVRALTVKIKKVGAKRINFACISDIRYNGKQDEKKDASLFGFNHEEFELKPLTQYILKTDMGRIFGELIMVGIKSADIKKKITETQRLVIKAAKTEISKGAKIILLAANLKAIFGRGEKGRKKLKKLFPNTLFLLGDNLVVYFILQQIKNIFKEKGLNPKTAKILIVAPRGLIASNLIEPLRNIGVRNIIGMLNPEKGEQSSRLIGEKLKIETITSFNDISNVDIVLACGSQECYRLNEDNIKQIKTSSKLIVLDPSEPQNITDEVMKRCSGILHYIRAGNGYNEKMNYVLKNKAAELLGLKNHITWGCFSETMCLSYLLKKYPNLIQENWFGVFQDKIKLIGETATQLGFKPCEAGY